MSPQKTVLQQRLFPDDLVHLFYQGLDTCHICSAIIVAAVVVVRRVYSHGGEERRSSPRVVLVCPLYFHDLSSERREVVLIQCVLLRCYQLRL